MVDANHRAARVWIAKGAPPEPPTCPDGTTGPDDLADLMNWKLGEVTEKWGTPEECARWLGLRKTAAAAQRFELENRKSRDEVITRELVTHAFGELERLSRHLLTGASVSIAARAVDMHDAGKPMEAIRKVAREIVGSELDATWSTIAKMMRTKP